NRRIMRRRGRSAIEVVFSCTYQPRCVKEIVVSALPVSSTLYRLAAAREAVKTVRWLGSLSGPLKESVGKPRSGEMFMEHRTGLRSGSSFRSATEYLSPINGLCIGGLEPFL